ncbi:MAG: type II toxin-antitoxin system prevent-host-death family antitoxin [Candidatus Aminicenantes bacterium]|nr:type II toxin-antitoxin system prevent-host-death family antitoxin [Candidatus Aminicenantes bacterium]
MIRTIAITDAKAKLSELVNRVLYNKEKIYISKKGKNVAALIPIEEIEKDKKEGLICAKGALSDLGDSEIDEMVEMIYKARKDEKSRQVDI